jgi:two-component system sporulation sensor kinase A
MYVVRRSEVFKEMAESHRNGKPYEFQIRHLDGRAIWVEIQAVAVRDGEGRSLFYESILKDITERKFAEETLRESEENFRMLIEHAPVAIFCQAGGRFQYLNPSALKLFGADAPNQIVGRLVFDHIHPDSLAASRERRRILIE